MRASREHAVFGDCRARRRFEDHDGQPDGTNFLSLVSQVESGSETRTMG